jgi:sialate O-acetylesterase
MSFKTIFIRLLAACYLAASVASASVAVSPLFSRHMVLQRGKPVPVYGTAAAGETIIVAFGGQSLPTTADAQGRWLVSLATMAANTTGRTLTITGTNTITITDVLVGDVWITSGQSNMEMALGSCNRQTEDVNTASYPSIRHFYVPPVTQLNPTKSLNGSWSVCSPSTASGFGAIGFYFARKLQLELGSTIPIGILQAPRGATAIDPWLAQEGLTDIPLLQPLYSQIPYSLGWVTFGLFNGTIYPLAPYAFTGMLWYQGESGETSNQSVDSYYLKEKALAQGWKRLWGMDAMPFYVVHLAAFNSAPSGTNVPPESGNWTDIRIQQTNVLGLPNGGVASAIDVGDAADIHPKNKLDVGERLALWALKNEYGRSSVVPSGPILNTVTVVGNKAICTFDYVGAGLMVGSKTAYQPTTEVVGGTLGRFSIAGPNGTWYDATAVITGSTVELTSPSVTTPTKVAYACFNNPAGANLYNRDGLPAAPFYVDNISAKFAITASAGANGAISPTGATTYLKRKTALYTITPDNGYYIQNVTVDGTSVGAVKTYTFDPIYANHMIAASFTAIQPNYTIAPLSSANGTVTPAGNASVSQGDSKTYTLVPNAGCRIVGLSVDGAPMGIRNSFTFGNVRSNHAITGNFAVIPSPGIGTGLRGDYFAGAKFDAFAATRTDANVNFSWGAAFPVTALTTLPYSVRWSGQIEPQFTETYSFYLSHHDGARLWVNNTLVIDRWQTGTTNDAVTVSLTGGQKVPIKIEYHETSGFSSCSLEWASTSLPREVVPQTQLYPATLVITPSVSTGGSISPNGPVVVNSGGSQTFTITPAVGYGITDVKVDNVSVGAIATYPFSNVTTSHTITATFNLLPTYLVTGKVTNQTTGFGIPGALVGFCATAGTWPAPAFTATADASGNYSQNLANGTWYVYSFATGYYKSPNQTVTVSGVPLANANIALASMGRNIPSSDQLVSSWVTDSLPASGSIASWSSYYPSNQPLTKSSDTGSPTVQTVGGIKWASNLRTNGDGFNHSTLINTAIPCTGASVVMAVKPVRNTTADAWTCCFDVYCYSFSFGIRNNTGNVCVYRNNAFFDYASAVIPDGQTTIMSAVVQADGKFKIFANGVQIVNETTTSTFTQMTPGSVGWQQNISLGRTSGSGWSSFNGYLGDTFFYRSALSDTDRQALETDLIAKFTGSGPTSYTITASAGTGGSITPTGAVTVNPGTTQTFTITPNIGYIISEVTVDGGSVGAVGSYTFSNVTANHTIAVTFTNNPAAFDITASAGSGGALDPAGTVQVSSGASQTFTITPNIGYIISEVTVDGCSVGSVGSYTFSNVTANHTIAATFISSDGGTPRPDQLLYFFNHNDLSADGSVIQSWGGFTKYGTGPTVAIIDGVKWEKNLRSTDNDGFDGGSFGSKATNGASFVMAIKPIRNPQPDAWNCLFDIGCQGLTVGIRNNTGGLTVFRKGRQYDYSTGNQIIPDGQKTILSCIFQEDGSFKIYANGVLIVSNTSTGDENLPLNPILPWYGDSQQAAGSWADRISLVVRISQFD